MRRLGLSLLWLGAGIGVATGVGVLTGVHPSTWSWLMVVGFAKLAGVSSLGVMGAGAACLRLHRRDVERQNLLGASSGEA